MIVWIYRNSADGVLSTAQRIIDLLKGADEAQAAADKAITDAELEISETDDQLTAVQSSFKT